MESLFPPPSSAFRVFVGDVKRGREAERDSGRENMLRFNRYSRSIVEELIDTEVLTVPRKLRISQTQTKPHKHKHGIYSVLSMGQLETR